MNDTTFQLQNISSVINDSILSVTESRDNHLQSMFKVPPRVIPVFLKEIGLKCSPAYRIEHIKQFISHIDDIFTNTKVIDDDVVHLLVSLLTIVCNDKEQNRVSSSDAADCCSGSVSSPPRHTSSSHQGVTVGLKEYVEHPPLSPSSLGCNYKVESTTSFHVMRLILSLFDVKNTSSKQCYRAMRRYSSLLTRRRAVAEEGAEASIIAAKRAAFTKSTIVHDSKETNKDLERPSFTEEDRPTTCNNDLKEHIHRSTDVTLTTSPELWMDAFLHHDSTRAMVLELWRLWDIAGIDISFFTQFPEKLHLYIPNRRTSRLHVYRDFVMCTARPKLTKTWGSVAVCHIKTNIPAKSEIMYRILIEGFNYGVNAVVFSDVVGYTNRNWDILGAMEKYGWPQGWDVESTNDYASGAAISQYFSNDGFVVVRLKAKSMYCIGFSVSAWLVFHGMGEGYPISATIHHQDADL